MAFSSVVWLAIGIIIMACEIFVPGFIIFWFGAGGVITAFLIFIGLIPEDQADWQWIFFFLSSFAMLGVWQFYFRKKFQSSTVDKSRDVTLNELRGRVTEKIEPGIPGEIELYTVYHGIKKWKAESDEHIEAGGEIAVIGSNGIRLIVKKNN